MSVCSLLQLDTVEGMVFSLLPLRFSSSSCSSLLSLLMKHKRRLWTLHYTLEIGSNRRTSGTANGILNNGS